MSNKVLKTKMMIKKILSIALVMFTLSACYNTKGDVYVSDLDIIVTTFDDTYDFTGAQTFYLPDTVLQLGLEVGDDPLDGIYDELIISKTRQNLLDLGYIEETDPENNPVDLVVLLQSVVVDFHNIYGGYPPYYPGYPGYPGYPWGPGWGWGGYPVIVQSYSKGTVMINMVDPDAIDGNTQTVPRVWIGLLNGLAEGSASNVRTRIGEGIDKAFDQSPYLGQ